MIGKTGLQGSLGHNSGQEPVLITYKRDSSALPLGAGDTKSSLASIAALVRAGRNQTRESECGRTESIE